MALIVSDEDGNEIVDQTGYEDEAEMQEYIEENPEVIPLHQIKEGTNFSVITREYTVDGESVDAIILDEDGDIYIVETKLESNSDKRQVIAQAFDYGAALWDTQQPYETINQLEKELTDYSSLQNWTEEELSLGEDTQEIFREQLKENLDEGNFTYVIVMDGINERLKTLIKYLNQNSSLTLFGVELEYYEYDEQTIAKPNIYGTELKSKRSKNESIEKKQEEEAYDYLQSEIKQMLDFEPEFGGRTRYRQVRMPEIPSGIHFEYKFDKEETVLKVRLDFEMSDRQDLRAEFIDMLDENRKELEEKLGEPLKERGRKKRKVWVEKPMKRTDIPGEEGKTKWALDTMETFIEVLRDDLIEEFGEEA